MTSAPDEEILAIPGVVCVAGPSAGAKEIYTGAAAGWMTPRGIMSWEHEISCVTRSDAAALAEALRATLPHEQIAPKKFPIAKRAAESAPLVAVSLKLVADARAQGVRVHTIGVDRVSAGFYYFAEGGGKEPVRVQGNLVGMLAPSLGASSTNDEIQALLDVVIDRLLTHLSGGTVSEIEVELANALPRLARDTSELEEIDIQGFDSAARALSIESAHLDGAARELVEALGAAARRGDSVARVPLYGHATRTTLPPLKVQLGGTLVELPARTEWTVTGAAREEKAAAASPAAPAAAARPAAASPAVAASPAAAAKPAAAASPYGAVTARATPLGIAAVAAPTAAAASPPSAAVAPTAAVASPPAPAADRVAAYGRTSSSGSIPRPAVQADAPSISPQQVVVLQQSPGEAQPAAAAAPAPVASPNAAVAAAVAEAAQAIGGGEPAHAPSAMAEPAFGGGAGPLHDAGAASSTEPAAAGQAAALGAEHESAQTAGASHAPVEQPAELARPSHRPSQRPSLRPSRRPSVPPKPAQRAFRTVAVAILLIGAAVLGYAASRSTSCARVPETLLGPLR